MRPPEHRARAVKGPEVIDLGSNLFRDRNTLESKLLIEDVFNPERGYWSRLRELGAKIDCITQQSYSSIPVEGSRLV